MECSKCGKNASKGRVTGGQFVCSQCSKAETQAKAEGQVRYALVGKQPHTMKIVAAKYSETAKRYNKIEADPDWPDYEAYVLKRYSWLGMPGNETPQAAVTKALARAKSTFTRNEKIFKEGEAYLHQLTEWAKQQGFETETQD